MRNPYRYSSGCSCKLVLVLLSFLVPMLIFPISSDAFPVIDYESHLNPLFTRVERAATKYIIVHTSEEELEPTLKIVSLGKQEEGKWVSHGGHAHYVIDRSGGIYKVLDDKYRAHHAGLSMWNGECEINRVSVGIELVAYHNGEITDSQYGSIGYLIRTLKKKYHLNDLSVLTHSQVAYARPNQWVSFNHRGRKNCARNFSRTRAGLGPTYPYDPDVKAGRLLPDELLTAIFYPEGTHYKKAELAAVHEQMGGLRAIAGESYDSPDTIYRLPGGVFISGNRVGERIGWGWVPGGTVIYFD
jgi:N-acetylmuramoyl-L-alanine amidase